ncbi:MAG: hypothetical protein M3120_03350 [Pseudomonadota bacterium]|nr:hypothetical protein [Pseudomonadota bacterium]
MPAHIAAATATTAFARMVALPITFTTCLMACMLSVLAWCSTVAGRLMLAVMRISRGGIPVLSGIGVCQADNARQRKRKLPVQKRQQEDAVQKPDE